jgi:hypothetical protein
MRTAVLAFCTAAKTMAVTSAWLCDGGRRRAAAGTSTNVHAGGVDPVVAGALSVMPRYDDAAAG